VAAVNVGAASFLALASLPVLATPVGLALGIVDGRFSALLAGPVVVAWLAVVGSAAVRFRGELRAFVANAAHERRGEA
jgi:TRAP-type C4-dicarboxylate transport system permease large subunit